MMTLRGPPEVVVEQAPHDYPSRIEWVGSIQFHLASGEDLSATRVLLATNGDFLDGTMPDYALWVETTLAELRKLGLPRGLLPRGRGTQRVLLVLEAPDDVLEELNDLGATKDFDTLMDDARFLDLAFGIERLTPSSCDVVTSEWTHGVAA